MRATIRSKQLLATVCVISAWIGIAQSQTPSPPPLSPADKQIADAFEKRAKEGPGLLGAGLVGIQKALDPAMQKAVEAQEDLKRGRYNKEDESGDPPEGGDVERASAENRTERGGAGSF